MVKRLNWTGELQQLQSLDGAMSVFKVHSTRAVSSSAAKARGMSTADRGKAADWTRVSVHSILLQAGAL